MKSFSATGTRQQWRQFFKRCLAKILGWGLTMWLVMVAHSQPALAQTVVFQDDFSNGFEKWDVLRGGEYWRIIDGQAEAYLPNWSTLAEMVPKDAYWDGSWKDIEYEFDYYPVEGFDKNVSFNIEDVNNWYEFHFLGGDTNLVRLDDGQATFDTYLPFTVGNGEVYRMLIRFNKGRIQLFINNQLYADQIDPTFNNNYGKIGIKAGRGAYDAVRVRYDNIVVRTLDGVGGTAPTPTPVPTSSPVPSPSSAQQVEIMKQGDPQWGQLEYDHATSWSTTPTIKRWGCALTSMAMVMRFHGITQLPDGTALNPASLNAWLKQQSDGYIGEGAINWQAATRLTRLISEKFGTVKLEYRRADGGSLETAKQELAAKKPVILQIPGHFLVGDGVTTNGSDLT